MNNNDKYVYVFGFLTLYMLSPMVQAQNSEDMTGGLLSIDEAVNSAKLNDPWLTGSEFKQSELSAMAVAAGQLPDPQMSIGMANLAADSFAFNQEPMTQFKVGVSQMFSRGDSRSLKTQQMSLLASEQPLLRANRLALLTREVSLLWLDAFQAQQSIRLIEEDRSLFEQLVDLVSASYSAGFGQSRQNDVIRAQLELTRLEDRLTQLKQVSESSAEQLRGYISNDYLDFPNTADSYHKRLPLNLGEELPEICLITKNVLEQMTDSHNQQVMQLIMKHPAVQALDKQIEVENKGVELAKQKYKPAWGLNASYGYRGDAENNLNRADLFSVGVTFDVPLFTKNRQDQSVKAAIASVAVKESQKTLLLRQLSASYDQETANLIRMQQRQTLFTDSLLPQMNQQVEASLTAYTHDDGDFAEVIRAKIAELNAKIDALNISIGLAKSKVKLNYLLAGANIEHFSTNNQAAKNTEHDHE